MTTLSAYVIVQFGHPLPRTSRGTKAGLDVRQINRLIARSGGLTLGTQDASTVEAGGSITISVPDMARANELAGALQKIEGVEAAYAKPGEELP
jgi:hypothetical protein